MAATNIDAATKRHQHVFVAPQHALGHARCAAGVEDVQIVVAARSEVSSGRLRSECSFVIVAEHQHVGEHRRVSANAFHTFEELGSNDQRFEIGVVEDVGQLVFDIAIVDVHPDRAQLEHCPQGLDPLGTVQRIDTNVIAGANALGGKVMCELIGAGFGLGVGASSAGAHDVIAVGPFVDCLLKQVGEIERCCGHPLIPPHF